LFGVSDVRLRKLSDLDFERPAHSRLRSSAREFGSDVAWPR
jgi:hypothetical protein